MIARIIALTLALPAYAQESCGPHDAQIAGFKAKYGEVVVGMGLHVDGRLFEVVVDADDGSWSVLATLPSGVTCLVAGGDSWQGINGLRGEPS